MNCPVCNYSNLPEGATSCPQCNSDIEAYGHITLLDIQIKKHKQTILILGSLLVLAIVTGGFLLSKNKDGGSPVINTEELNKLKSENAQLQNAVNELKKQVEEKEKQLQAQPMAENKSAVSNTYLVKRGESLWMIAQKELGDGNKYMKIAKENSIENPDKLAEGTELKISK